MVPPETRLSVPALTTVWLVTNCWRANVSVPGNALVSAADPMSPLSTVKVCPEATWRYASVEPKFTTGTERVEPVPVPLARMAPEVRVRVVGFRPERPPTFTEPEAELFSASALRVWLPVRELEVLYWALKVCAAEADRTFAAAV